MNLDSTTIHVCNALLNGTYGVMFMAVWADRREQAHFGYWGLSLLINALSVIGFSFLDVIPGWLNSLFLASIATNTTLVWGGMRAFDGLRPFTAPMWIVPALTFVIHRATAANFTRDVASAAGIALLAVNVLLLAHYVFRNGEDRKTFWRRVCVAALLAYVPFYIVSIIEALTVSYDNAVIILLSDQVLNNIFVVALFVLTLQRSRRVLEEQALKDGLTGALNRMGLMAKLAERPQLAPRAVLVADLDHFKTINDRFGHAAGDTVLQSFVRLARERLGPHDLLARTGGEEFVLVLEGAAAKTATDAAEQLRRKVAETPAHWNELPIPTTVSIGIAEFEDASDLARAMERADRALYRAKETGRNRIAA